ncbi:uncharacterized protein LOC135349272 [Halichondria panicea]|uniref:uncharacterized protein LOC135349272 n=1 Tax=Halichondria panicea TaxID=6063 RepID=UPI00312BC587
MASGLQEAAENSVILNLGEVAKTSQCRFSCGGSLPQVDNVTIHYKKKPGNYNALTLPTDLTVIEDKNLPMFLEACSTAASFGTSSQTFTDPTYRDALKLDPDCFTTNFELANTTILRSIASIMACGSSIRAKLYKLNVYSNGGHFKAHLDTPRSAKMFGSLVVSLPSQFTGGALVTRHQGHTMTFDWSSSPTTTQWAAFYSDVEHEVLPVTSGHRFTLTYNLYHTLSACHPVSLDITTSPLHKELQAALKTPHFMREGGTLGFFCRYRYVDCESNEYYNHFIGDTSFLKGEDMIIYRVAKSLGLSVQLKAICGGDNKFHNGKRPDFIVSWFQHRVKDYPNKESDIAVGARLNDAFGSYVETAENVCWCVWKEERKVPLLSFLCFGNEPTAAAYYQSAALLIEVPNFTSGRGVSVASVQAVLSCIEQVNEEVERVEADLNGKTRRMERLEESAKHFVDDVSMQKYLLKEKMKLKSRRKIVQNRHTELITERNEMMCMVPPSKRAKIKK